MFGASGDKRSGLGGWKVLRMVALVLVAIMVMAACGGDDDADSDNGADADPGEEETLETLEITVIDPGASATYAFIEIANQLGYFEEEGLVVSQLPGDGSAGALALMIAGQGEFTIAGVEPVLAAMANGEEVNLAYSMWTQPAYGLIVREDSDVTDPAELEGKTIGVTSLAGGEVPVTVGLMRDSGVSFEDYRLVPIGEEIPSIAEALDSGRIDAFGGAASDFAGLGAAGVDIRELESENQLEFPGAGIASTNAFLEEHPDRLNGFLRAVSKGIHAWMTVPDIAESTTRITYPEFWEDAEASRFLLNAQSERYRLPEGRDDYGLSDPQVFATYVEYLAEPIPGRDPLVEDAAAFPQEAVLVEPYIAEWNDFDRAAVEADARAFMEENPLP